MYGLTLRHPWPYAIAKLGKDVENRTWAPSPKQLIIGEWFALHGGAKPKAKDFDEVDADWAWIISKRLLIPSSHFDEIIIPGIFAVARFNGCVSRSFSPWFTGPFGWTWTNLIVLPEPVPCKGAQGLWSLPSEVEIQVRKMVGMEDPTP